MSDPAQAGASYARLVLGTLFGVYMVHHLDRMTISLLLEPIGREFQLSDTQRGVLAGIAYALPFAIAGIPLGLLIDRVNRVRLLSTLLAIWSSLTALCAFATGFWWLLLARMGVGAAESGGTPANMSILADYFPPAKRARAYGVYYMAPHAATIIGFAAAGAVALHYGWRAALLLVGLPGVLLAVVLLLAVREPQRSLPSQGSPSDHVRIATVLRTLWACRPGLHLMLGGALSSMVTAGVSTWLPPFMMRSHGVGIDQVGYALAFAVAPVAALASFLGGQAADRLGGHASPRVPAMLAISLMVSSAALWIGLGSSSFAVLVVCIAIQTATYVLTVAPSYAGVVGLMPPNMRGVSAAMLQVLSNVLGFGVGVYAVGQFSDLLKVSFGDQSLRYTLYIYAGLNVLAVTHFMLAARHLRHPQSLRTR